MHNPSKILQISTKQQQIIAAQSIFSQHFSQSRQHPSQKSFMQSKQQWQHDSSYFTFWFVFWIWLDCVAGTTCNWYTGSGTSTLSSSCLTSTGSGVGILVGSYIWLSYIFGLFALVFDWVW